MKPITERRRRGDLGEAAAARYLRRRLYRILDRNWFFYKKEIDIVARRGNTLVICEVKTRTRDLGSSSPYGTASAAVDAEKQHNLSVAARAYVRAIGWRKNVRMDIIEVYLKENEKGALKVAKLVHIRNAFPA